MSKHCIDCQNPLTDSNRSPHQPKIRCRACFKFFSDGVEAFFSGRAKSARGYAKVAAEAAKGQKGGPAMSDGITGGYSLFCTRCGSVHGPGECKARLQPAPVGWLCPKCQRVNAPSVLVCQCSIPSESEAVKEKQRQAMRDL